MRNTFGAELLNVRGRCAIIQQQAKFLSSMPVLLSFFQRDKGSLAKQLQGKPEILVVFRQVDWLCRTLGW
jgi:hypothetical protein